jgi:hypothetical protein
VPTTAVGLLIFILTLAPGFLYLVVAERGKRPFRKISAFRETSTLVLISVAADLAVLLLFAMCRVLISEHTPDFGRIVREPRPYFREDYAYLLSWVLALFLLACLLSLVFAVLANRDDVLTKLRTSTPGKWMVPERGVQFESAWWRMFMYPPMATKAKRVTCLLTDGSRIQGWLWSFSEEASESADREVLLSGPLTFQAPDGVITHEQKGAVSVSARNLLLLQVQYEDGPSQP